MTAVLRKNKHSSSPTPTPPPPHKTKSKEELFNFIVKMLSCRDQADDLIGCIIIIMFEIINSQQEALHFIIMKCIQSFLRLYCMLGNRLFSEELRMSKRDFKNNALDKLTENKSMSQHRYAIYQLHHFKNQTKIMQL